MTDFIMCNDGELIDLHKYDFTPKCKDCAYAYYVYGCELNCERLNANKKCKFKDKTNDGRSY